MNCKTDLPEVTQCEGTHLLGLYHYYFGARRREQSDEFRRRSQVSSGNGPDPGDTASWFRSSDDIWAEIGAAWNNAAGQPFATFAECYGLDRVDVEILACIVSYQMSGHVRHSIGKTVLGSEVIEQVSQTGSDLALVGRFMPGSPLRDHVLISPHGPPWEGVLSLEWRVPDRVILQMTGQEDVQKRPASGASGGRCEATDIAEMMEPRYSLDSVVISDQKRDQINSLVAQRRCSDTIFDKWGLGNQVQYGRAATILLYGPSGTGKSLLAEAIAREAQLRLLVARYPGMEAAFVGDTEKNIAKLFRLAQSTGSALLIDECDAILNRRLDGNRSNDRFFNQQLLVFCQEIERFDGLIIMTTNRANALDEALDRRIALKLEMPLPDVFEREAIWRLHLTDKMPLADDLDAAALARSYRISGGQVKNAVVAAARSAIARSERCGTECTISMADLRTAAMAEISTYRDSQRDNPIGFGRPEAVHRRLSA